MSSYLFQCLDDDMDKIYSRTRIRLPKINASFFKKNNKNIPLFKVVAIIVIAIITASIIIRSINPIIEKNCENMAKSIATKISNEQATLVMSKYKYDDLCNISKDTNGNIAMISANIITVNEIISDIAVKIQDELNNENNNSFDMRLGAFTGIRLLSGFGPNINIKMSTIGNLDTNLKSEFTSAGVNQTLHRIYLEIKCTVAILTPFETMEEEILNQVLLSEAVIVGTTPNTYYNLEGMGNNNLFDVIE